MIAVAIMSATSCEVMIVPNVLNHVSIGVSPMNLSNFPAVTKADLEITDKLVHFAWDEDDIVGMFPDRGAQAYFEMADHAGNDVAEFDGGGWALKSASKYAVYYPYSYDHRERTSIPFHYGGQKQNGKGNYEHLKAFQHLATGAATPQNGACNYKMERAEAIVRFRLKLPRIAVYEQLTIKLADGSQFVVSTHLDVSGEQYQIRPNEYINKFVVSLENVKTEQEGEVVDFYLMMPPQNLINKKMIISVDTIDGDSCLAEIDGMNMANNYAYHYEATLSTDFGSSGEGFEGINGSWNGGDVTVEEPQEPEQPEEE